MAKNEEHLNLLFNVDDNIDDIIDKMQNMEDHVEGLDKMFSDFAKKGPKESMAAMAEMEDHIFEMNRGVNNLQKNFNLSDKLQEANVSTKDLMASMGEMSDIQVELEELTNDRINANTEAEKQAIDEIIAKRKDQFAKTKKMFDKHAKEVTESLQTEQKEMKRVFTDLDEQADETFSNMKQGAGGVFSGMASSLASGDVGGMLKGGGGFFDQALTGIGQKGQAAGEKAGVKMKAGGKGKMGGMVQGLGKFAGAVGKFAAAVGPVAMIASLLMKANAQTQELNKSFTETTPMIKMSADGLGAAEDHLAELRDTATDFATNVRLGLNPQEHMQIIGQLQEHNIMISELAESYGSYGKAAKEAVESIRVAQLNLGASSQEVGAFMGNMMDIHAQSFERTQKSLTSIVAEAEEAGISSKQFFSTVSQLTGQMGLYNFKLESSVALLSDLNKVMDSENAAEFTKELTHGLKNANAQERMRLMVLNSEAEVMEMVRDNAEQMLADFEDRGALGRWLEEMGKSTKDLGKTLGNLSTEEEIDLIAKAQRRLGEEGSRRLERMIAQFEAAEEGGFKLVDAMQDLGAIQNLELQVTAAEQVFGKPIQELSDMQADAMGIDANQLRAMKRFSTISKGNLRTLQAMSKKEDVTQEKFQRMAEQMGINAKMNEKGQIINENTGELIKDQYDVMKATKDERKDDIKKQAEEQKSAAERQVEETQNVANILQYMIADLLNELSVVTSEINSLLYKQFSGASDERIAQAELRSERKRKQAEIREIRKSARGRDLTKGEKAKIKTLEQEVQARKGIEKMVTKGEMPGSTYEEYQANASNMLERMRKSGAMGKISAKEFAGIKIDRSRLGARTRGRMAEEFGLLKDEKGVIERTSRGRFKKKGGGSLGLLEQKKALNRIRKEERAKMMQEEIGGKIISGKEGEEVQAKALEELKGETINQKKATDKVKEVLKDKGIQVQDKAATRIGKAIVTEKKKDEIKKTLKEGGWSDQNAEALSTVMANTSDEGTHRNVAKTLVGEGKKIGDKRYKAMRAARAKDARMVTGGIPFLNLQKGDIIVDEESLATTMRGGKGAMVPDLMKKAGLAGGGGGGGMRQNVNIVINGGDTSKVRQTVMKTLDYINRKKGGK